MANFTVPFLLIISLFVIFSIASSISIQDSNPISFIKSSCNVTRYPVLCFRSLSIFSSTIQTSPRTMAQAALAVSLSTANTVNEFILNISKSGNITKAEHQAVDDCIDNFDSCIYNLRRSMDQMGNMGHGGSFDWHMSNVITWVSGAHNFETTYIDEFDDLEGGLKMSIVPRVTHLAKVTSNALALVEKFGNEQ